MSSQEGGPFRALTAPVIMAAILFSLSGLLFYRHESRAIREEKYEDLAAIAKLKAESLAAWRKERLSDARMNSSGLIRQYAERWLGSPHDSSARSALLERMLRIRDEEGYQSLILAGLDGSVRLSLESRLKSLEPETRRLAAEALASRGPVLGDFIRCALCGSVHLDAAAPVLGANGRPIALLFLRTDPERYLYPLIQSWPVSSRSAETLLVRREGDDVLFLNKLRHDPSPPLTFRTPLSRTDLPAARALLGHSGVFEGRDYRGKAVLADLRRIPGTDWHMVAKVDAEELLSELHFRGVVISLFVLLGILLAGGLTALAYQLRQGRLLRALGSTERERDEARDEIRATLYGIGDGVISTGRDGRVTRMNSVAEALTGWKEGEALGKPLSQVFRIVNEDTRAEVENPVEKVMREGKIVGLANHTLLIAKDGMERPIADSGAPIFERDGRIIGVVLVFRDQSEERGSAMRLAASEERFRSVFELSNLPKSITHPDGSVDPNEALCRLLGYTREDLSRKNWRDITPLEDVPLVERTIGELVSGMKDRARFEKRYLRKDGSIVFADVAVSAKRDKAGRLEYFITAISDITARKLLEERLTKLSLALEQSPSLVLITDAKGDIEYVNPRFTEVTGYALDDVRGRNPRLLKSGETPAEEYRRLWETITGGGVWRGELHNKKRDGSLYWERAAIAPVRNSAGDIIAYLGIKEDITAQKTLETQLGQSQKMESIGRLAGGVAHDFNNLLTAIRGYAEFVKDALPAGSTQREDVQEILTAAERASALTQQLLAFSRRQILNPQVVDLNGVTGNTLKLLKRLIGEDILIETRLANEPCPVRVDSGQITQVLLNLAVNARDAMPKGGILSIGTGLIRPSDDFFKDKPSLKQGPLIVLTVSDTGCGMSEDVQAHLFEPFFTTKEKGKGTGLGLATVYGIVKQSGGEILVESAPGKGTRFCIYLPRIEAAAQAEGAAKAASLKGNETVLLIEDEAIIRRLAERALAANGYTVLTAPSGQEALHVLERHGRHVDIVLTDVVMPGMSGREVARKIALMGMSRRTLYISGYTDDAIVEHGVLEPGLSFLYKPFSPEGLLRKLRETLDGPADQAKA